MHLLSYGTVTIDEIRELISLVTGTGVAELEVQRGDNRVRIRLGAVAQDYTAPFNPASLPAAGAPPPVAAKAAAASAAPDTGQKSPSEAADFSEDEAIILVKSPIVGTFYEGASPGSPPFVRIGENVQPGKVLCIIESMKLMNEIEAEVAGVVESKLVMNGQPVEYGEALFAIRPV